MKRFFISTVLTVMSVFSFAANASAVSYTHLTLPTTPYV